MLPHFPKKNRKRNVMKFSEIQWKKNQVSNKSTYDCEVSTLVEIQKVKIIHMIEVLHCTADTYTQGDYLLDFLTPLTLLKSCQY